MKIQLSQDEIAQAVRDYVSKGVTLSNGNQMSVDFSMGRGENGLSATIDVPYMGVSGIDFSQPVKSQPAVAQNPVSAVVSTPVPAPTPAVTSTVQAAEAAIVNDATANDEVPFAGSTEAAPAATAGKSLFQSPAAG